MSDGIDDERRRLLLVLVALATVLAVTSFATVLLGDRVPWTLSRFLRSDGERNLPAYVNVVVLLAVSVAAALAAVLARWAQPPVPRATRLWWWAVAAVLFLASFDEATSVHETVGRALRPSIQSLLDGRGGALSTTTWLLPGIAVAVVLLAGLVLGWRHAPPLTRTYLVVGFVILLTGAVGFEILSDRAYVRAGERTLLYHGFATIEEWLELVGASVMVTAVLRSIDVQRLDGGVKLAYRGSSDPDPGERRGRRTVTSRAG